MPRRSWGRFSESRWNGLQDSARSTFTIVRLSFNSGKQIRLPFSFAPRLDSNVVGLNRFAVVVRGRSHRCTFGDLPAVIFSLIFPLTHSLRAVLASVNQIHSRRHYGNLT